MAQSWTSTELSVVVFGGKFAGKSSLINAVFGKKLLPTGVRTAQCKKLQGSVCRRDLTLVDTPGWWRHFPLSDTPDFLKKELVRGISLCKPGPHIVLLAIENDIPFTEKQKKAAEDHLGLLGDQIWKHTLVVFTKCHFLRDKTIEEHIRTEGEALQKLIKKCQNRYHVFDSVVKDNGSQVRQLLEKIDDIVQVKHGGCFQIEATILKEVSDWRLNVNAKAKNRRSNVQKQRQNVKKEGLSIALVGWVIAGKRSAGNTIFNKEVFRTDEATVSFQIGHGEVDGRQITVINTPSWFKYFPSQYTPVWKKSEFIKGVSQPLYSPHCILLVIPADTSFKQEQRKVIQENMSLLGEHVWRYTILLFTWGDILGDLTIEQHIESEGDALQWVTEKCGSRYHVFNNEKREDRVQVTELLEKIDDMVSRNSLFQMSTPEFSGITTRQSGADTQADFGPDNDLQNIIQNVDKEWKRRDKELLQNVSKIMGDIKARGDASIDVPPYLPENIKEKEDSQTEGSSCGTGQHEDKDVLTLKDQIKEVFEQEWNRRKEALIGKVMDMLSEHRCESRYSEPDEHVLKQSEMKVSRWLQTEGSEGYASLPDTSHHEDT